MSSEMIFTVVEVQNMWMEINGEAIYGTRPWRIYGEEPSENVDGVFNEKFSYTAGNFRFTKKGGIFNVITLGLPINLPSKHAVSFKVDLI